jgi:probable rRNA maturation factor
MIRVAVSSPQDAVPIDRARMREVVRTVLEGEGETDAEISLAFVDNPTSRRLNQRYLNHDEPTDILSFPLSEAKTRQLSGELVVGAEVAKVEAESRGHDIQSELALYIIHGLLHLCGYDDKTPAAIATMRERERYYLGKLGCPDISPGDD